MTWKSKRTVSKTPIGEPVADAIYLQPPARVRLGADREIDHETVKRAIRAFRKQGGRIRKIRMKLDRPQLINVNGHKETLHGFHEVDLVEDERLARSGI